MKIYFALVFLNILAFKFINLEETVNSDGFCNQIEPFHCVGSNICISLQYVCDGNPYDCPMNQDENVGLCLAVQRPPKDILIAFLESKYNNHGTKFIKYLFGFKAAQLCDSKSVNIIDSLATALIVLPTIDDFAFIFQMNKEEKQRLMNVLESVYTGNFKELPKYIVDSIYDGLNVLAEKLIKTGFI